MRLLPLRCLIPPVLAAFGLASCGPSSPPPPVSPPAAPVGTVSAAPVPGPAPVKAAPVPAPKPAASVSPAEATATAPPSAAAGSLPTHYTVRFVKDGDSVTLTTGEDLRYIGIDTPEFGSPFSDEARELNRRLVEGKSVRVEYDEETRDKHNRLLAYVYVTVDDGGGATHEVFVNAEMLRQGLARVYPHEKTRRHAGEFLKLQQEAMPEKKGIWGVDKPMDVAFFIGTRKGKAYHRPDCKFMQEVPESARTRFSSREEAERGGKTPCRSCNP
ncbi:MAG: thermonuclease family protein [Planctomycetes bacterium]|nr:thermonuclease family protein [Planctomycetota bacterium]